MLHILTQSLYYILLTPQFVKRLGPGVPWPVAHKFSLLWTFSLATIFLLLVNNYIIHILVIIVYVLLSFDWGNVDVKQENKVINIYFIWSKLGRCEKL